MNGCVPQIGPIGDIIMVTLQARFEAMDEYDLAAEWGQWTSEDWRDNCNKPVIVQTKDGDYKMGVVESTGAAPWDLNLVFDDGSTMYRGGDAENNTGNTKVRLYVATLQATVEICNIMSYSVLRFTPVEVREGDMIRSCAQGTTAR